MDILLRLSSKMMKVFLWGVMVAEQNLIFLVPSAPLFIHGLGGLLRFVPQFALIIRWQLSLNLNQMNIMQQFITIHRKRLSILLMPLFWQMPLRLLYMKRHYS